MTEEKIKYVLNGKTQHYTREELTEYLVNLYRKNGITLKDEYEDITEQLVNKTIKTLQEYDGDPYGNIKDEETRNICHKLEIKGCLLKTL